MASKQVNDVWVGLVASGTMGLLQVDATGASMAALTITTQTIGTLADLNARLQGSNDGASWFDIGSPVSIGDVGAKEVTGAVSGYAWIRALITRVNTGSSVLISGAINTGL